jgi:glycosyltransferase involved in cell wall biosynthesis
MVVLKALHLVKKNGPLPFGFVFTGKTTSIRGDNYYKELRSYMEQHGLLDDIIVTDFVERNDQLVLMTNAIAIVQPTTFEGWSTVIEDAKALNQYVVASNIPVNMEQVNQNVTFFDPADEKQLAAILQGIVSHPPERETVDYQANIQHSMDDLVKIFQLT